MLSKVQLKQLGHEDKQWSCEKCKELFQFNHLDDNEFIFTVFWDLLMLTLAQYTGNLTVSTFHCIIVI